MNIIKKLFSSHKNTKSVEQRRNFLKKATTLTAAAAAIKVMGVDNSCIGKETIDVNTISTNTDECGTVAYSGNIDCLHSWYKD